jgi:hypothetical protein
MCACCTKFLPEDDLGDCTTCGSPICGIDGCDGVCPCTVTDVLYMVIRETEADAAA